MKRHRVFVTGSLWSLLTYMLISSEDDILRTRYFFTNKGIHESVRKNFNHHVLNISWDDNLDWRLKQFIYIWRRLYYQLRYPFLSFSDIYGIDQGRAIQSVIGNREYTLIEDGILDYQVDRTIPSDSKDWLRKLLWGPIYKHDFGRNTKCKKIILTQPFSDPILSKKAIYYNLENLWRESSESKKDLILNKFNLTTKDIDLMSKRPVILLTQALSEDGIFSEYEKINFYRRMIEPYGMNNVLIKPHPRERTDYSKSFPECIIMDKVVPFQLFSLIGIKFKIVVTVCSGAALSLQNEDTLIDFKGSEIDPRISSKYGIITKDSYK